MRARCGVWGVMLCGLMACGGEVTVVGEGAPEKPTAAAAADDPLDGDYVLSVAASPDPSRPIRFRAFVDATPEEVSLWLAPLGADGNEVAAELGYGPFVRNREGGFRATFDTMVLPPDANPITGSEIFADWALETLDPAHRCGMVDGTLHAPVALSLAGSTFAMVPWRADVSTAPSACTP